MKPLEFLSQRIYLKFGDQKGRVTPSFFYRIQIDFFNKKETVETALMLSLPLGRRMAAPCPNDIKDFNNMNEELK